jgi:hypothetical protein
MGSVRLNCRIISPYSKTFKYNDNPVTFCYMKCHRIKVVLVEIRKKKHVQHSVLLPTYSKLCV